MIASASPTIPHKRVPMGMPRAGEQSVSSQRFIGRRRCLSSS